MRKIVLLIIGVVIIALALYWWVSRTSPLNETFYVPEGFEGCANIVYNIAGAPVLKVEKHYIQYHLDEDGILLTSSPYDFGWEGQETSGLSKTKYYYVENNGEVSKEIPKEKIGEGTVGEYSDNGRLQITRYAIPIGNKEVSCAENHKELDKLVDEKLKEK